MFSWLQKLGPKEVYLRNPTIFEQTVLRFSGNIIFECDRRQLTVRSTCISFSVLFQPVLYTHYLAIPTVFDKQLLLVPWTDKNTEMNTKTYEHIQGDVHVWQIDFMCLR